MSSFIFHSWMTEELHLSGNELLIFMIIYNFSQDKESKFTGSRQYLADVVNCSLRSVQTALNNLVDKELIIKDEIINNGVKYCSYTQNFTPSAKIALNNISNTNNSINNNLLNINIENNKSAKIALPPTKKLSLFEKCFKSIADYTTDTILQDNLLAYLKFRLEVKDKPIYFNQWKGLLNKLTEVGKTDVDRRVIVSKSLEKGWLSFYENKEFFSKATEGNTRDGLKHQDSYSEEDAQRDKLLREERERNGQQTSF